MIIFVQGFYIEKPNTSKTPGVIRVFKTFKKGESVYCESRMGETLLWNSKESFTDEEVANRLYEVLTQ